MDGSDSDRRSTFARVLTARRNALGLTQRDVYAAGGPTPATLIRWERGADSDVPPPRPTALERLDGPLRWDPGTALKLYKGEINAEETLYRTPVPDDSSSESAIFQALDLSYIVMNQTGLIIQYISATLGIEGIDPALKERGSELKEEVLELYTTLMLHHFGGPGQTLPNNIGPLLTPALDAEEPPKGTPEHHRWAYRRWLAGEPFGSDGEEEVFRKYWESTKYGRI
ncbi:helix-turn-helix domain-containing protein [Corynebacterium sp. AOP40-9SA-29]|uniref:helix-turn-helix domain-containing protein n=1 Tax=Corynebacterium sp. AOP40-9SA-29 TaxID=3457677 RepID=UPI0040347FED